MTAPRVPAPGAGAPGAQAPRVPAPVPRLPLLAQGVSAAVVGGVLALAAVPGASVLAVALLLGQVLLALALFELLVTPGGRGAALVAGLAALAGNLLVLRGTGEVDALAGVCGLALVGALLHQLVRRARARVTESLAGTLLAVVLVVSAACLLGLRRLDGGGAAVVAALVAAAAGLLAGRLGDRAAPTPPLAEGATRGLPGLLLALLGGAAAAAGVAGVTGELPVLPTVLLGLGVATAAAVADLAVEVGAAELTGERRNARRVAALRPVGVLLPYAVVGPVALLAGRLVLA